MRIPRLLVTTCSIGVMAARAVSGHAASTGSEQAYPNKPIRIVTGGAGGSVDFVVRMLAQGLTANVGQQVIVDNRPPGVIPGVIVSQAPPDGYTLLFAGATLWIGSLLQKTPYDSLKDFSPITLTNKQPNVLVVHPSVAINSVRDLIAMAKSKPGALNYASGGNGSSTHLAAEVFKDMAGVNIVRIAYKGGGPALIDLLSGQVHMSFANAGPVMAHVKAGRLRALAVTSAKPSALAADLPTVAASGVPGYEAAAIVDMFAPAKTPDAVVVRLNRELVRVLNQADVKERFLASGGEAVGSTPQELTDVMKSEIARLGKLVKAGVLTNE